MPYTKDGEYYNPLFDQDEDEEPIMINSKAFYYDKYFIDDREAFLSDDRIPHHTVYIMQDGTDEYLSMCGIYTTIKNPFLAKIHLVLQIVRYVALEEFLTNPRYYCPLMYAYRKATDLERYMQLENERVLCIENDFYWDAPVFLVDEEFEDGLPSFIKRLFRGDL